jgi:hypothetical protein
MSSSGGIRSESGGWKKKFAVYAGNNRGSGIPTVMKMWSFPKKNPF